MKCRGRGGGLAGWTVGSSGFIILIYRYKGSYYPRSYSVNTPT